MKVIEVNFIMKVKSSYCANQLKGVRTTTNKQTAHFVLLSVRKSCDNLGTEEEIKVLQKIKKQNRRADFLSAIKTKTRVKV